MSSEPWRRPRARWASSPHEAAREIDRAAQVERFDLMQLGRESLETGHLLVPTIRALARLCEVAGGSTCTMA
ncbi:hypothetical protein P4114_16675 [Pseudomonas aeruginosa]|nr:hypothetical protein [Pseudomonas aeruginosa]